MTDCWSANGRGGKQREVSRGKEEQSSETRGRREEEGGGRRVRRWAWSSVSCLPCPPPSLLACDPSLFPPSASLQPVAISDFLGNLRNNTPERAQDSDTHNKPASVTLNPTHKKSSENSPPLFFARESFWETHWNRPLLMKPNSIWGFHGAQWLLWKNQSVFPCSIFVWESSGSSPQHLFMQKHLSSIVSATLRGRNAKYHPHLQ